MFEQFPAPTAAVLDSLTEPIPRAAILTAWWNCWLGGQCSADSVIDALSRFGTHSVLTPAGETVPLLIGLTELRNSAAAGTWIRVSLPAAGDPTGLPGPPAFNQAALSAGQAVIADGSNFGLVPESHEGLTLWTVLPTDPEHRASPPIRPEAAGSAVKAALLQATAALTKLDVARNRDAVAESLAMLNRSLRSLRLPPSLPGTHAHTVHTAAQVLGIVAIAAAEDDAHLTSPQRTERSRALTELAATARHCLAAACSAR